MRLPLVVAILSLAVPAAAGPVIVGNGTPASCTALALYNALVVASSDGRDVIRFNCGKGPVTIELSPTTQTTDGTVVALMPPNETTIDGGGLITLYSPPFYSMVALFANRDTNITLANLTIHGTATSYARVINRGTLVVKNVTFFDNHGGAIVNEGTLTVEDSMFSENQLFAIRNVGSARIDHSSFLNNGPIGSGGAINNSGTLDIQNSIFSGNRGDYFGGGAIYSGGTLTINNSVFSHNLTDQFGGAIVSFGSMTVTNSTFSSNFANVAGGGIVTSGTAVIKHCEFLNNGAYYGGGIATAGVLALENSTVSGNGGHFGGGIYNQGALTATNSLITSNTASVEGGGIYLTETASLSLVRTDVVDNTVDDIGPVE